MCSLELRNAFGFSQYNCSSPHGSAVRVCGLHCLPGDSAPSLRIHTTTKESLVSCEYQTSIIKSHKICICQKDKIMAE